MRALAHIVRSLLIADVVLGLVLIGALFLFGCTTGDGCGLGWLVGLYHAVIESWR